MIVLGVDDDGLDRKGRAGPDDTADRVERQAFTKPSALVSAIDCEAAKDRGRHGVVRQPFRQVRRQFILLEARGAQAVIAGDLPRSVAERHKHLDHAPPDILRHLPLKVRIKGRLSAGEGCPIMDGAERLDDQTRLMHLRARDIGARLLSASRSAPAG
jgi:hypothetical protein